MSPLMMEADAALAPLIAEVERGRDVTLTRHGRPIARVVAVAGGEPAAARREAAERIRARAVARKAGAFRWDEWRLARDEGRP